MTVLLILGGVFIGLLVALFIIYLFIWVPSKISDIQRDIRQLENDRKEHRDRIIKLEYPEGGKK